MDSRLRYKILKSVRSEKKAKQKSQPPQVYPKYVILPFFGEFGWFCHYYVNRVLGYDPTHTVVCIERGREVFFPGFKFYYVNKPNYDMSNPPSYMKLPREYIRYIKEKFPNSTILDFSENSLYKLRKLTLSIPKHTISYNPKYNIKVDVLIAPRNKKPLYRNWNHWEDLISRLPKNLKIGIIGLPDTTQNFKNISFRTWELAIPNPDIESIVSSKVVISGNSGIACLSALFGQKHIILSDQRSKKSIRYYKNQHSIVINNAFLRPNASIHKIIKIVKELAPSK